MLQIKAHYYAILQLETVNELHVWLLDMSSCSGGKMSVTADMTEKRQRDMLILNGLAMQR